MYNDEKEESLNTFIDQNNGNLPFWFSSWNSRLSSVISSIKGMFPPILQQKGTTKLRYVTFRRDKTRAQTEYSRTQLERKSVLASHHHGSNKCFWEYQVVPVLLQKDWGYENITSYIIPLLWEVK